MKHELIELIINDSVSQESQPKFKEAALCNAPESSNMIPTPQGVVVGTVVGLNEMGEPLVSFGESPATEAIVARSTVEIALNQIGCNAVLTLEGGDPCRPIIIGVLQPKIQGNREVRLDGERLTLSADKEIVLKCGEASITLTRAGKVLIRGTYLSSRSSGVHRIKGGSVQIN
jgi:hypothetical protein